MGGFYGHMSHLYDNRDLKFSQMMSIFKAAAAGSLKGTEKTDGQNLYVAYNVAQQKAKAVRNKTNARKGGIDAEELAQKFGGRGSVEKAFNEAFESFAKTAEMFPENTQKKIFGDGEERIVFFNAEIQDPRNANVINYDNKLLNIHRVGHVLVNLKTQQTTTIASEDGTDMSAIVKRLEQALSQVQRLSTQDDFSVQVNAIRQLEKLTDNSQLESTLQKLNSVLDSAGISDQQTVQDYLRARIQPVIDSQGDLPEENKNLLLMRLLDIKEDGKRVKINTIRKDLNPTQIRVVNMLVANSKSILQNAIQPIEDIVHDFSVESLKNLESAFVLDQEKEIQRLRKEVSKAIENIKSSGNEAAMETLNRQMRKLKSVENVSTAAEGFVFDYDGKTYKFTGNFAPINQLLGLFKSYSRGGINEEEILIDEQEDTKKEVVLIAGGFRPPHRGHLEMVKNYISKLSPAGEIIIFMSDTDNEKSQRYIGNDSTIGSAVTVQQSLKIWEIYLKNEGILNRVQFKLTEAGPMADVVELVKNSNPDDVKYYLAAGEKDQNRYQFMSQERYNPNNVELDTVAIPTVKDQNGNNMSATIFRNALANLPEQMNVVEDYIPASSQKDIDLITSTLNLKTEKKTLTMESLYSLVEQIMSERKMTKGDKIRDTKLKKKMDKAGVKKDFINRYGKEEGEKIYFATIRKRAMKEDDIEEISSMSAGNVQIGAQRKDATKNKTLIREYTREPLIMEFFNRNEFLQELKLRQVIRETIQKVRQNQILQEEKEINQEQQLRSFLKSLIKESKESHYFESTGINKLRKLFKNTQMLSTLRDGYKSLTTSKEQRESFRAHIINAVQNLLAPYRGMLGDDSDLDNNPDTDQLEEQDQLSVNISDEEKMIGDDGEPVNLKPAEEEDEAMSDEDQEKQEFTISGMDQTADERQGRNDALDAFKNIEDQIEKLYLDIENDDDREIFYNWLLTNLKLYFDQFEEEMQPTIGEPTTSEYEAEKDKQPPQADDLEQVSM